MQRIYLADMRKRGSHLYWRTTDGWEGQAACDDNLGSVMTAVSALARGLVGQAGAGRTTSDTALTEFRIEPLTVAPYAFRLIMESGPHRFTCHLDRDLEHILAGFGAAMRFFALKTHRIVIEEEVSRNTERARETGLYTAPEGSA